MWNRKRQIKGNCQKTAALKTNIEQNLTPSSTSRVQHPRTNVLLKTPHTPEKRM